MKMRSGRLSARAHITDRLTFGNAVARADSTPTHVAVQSHHPVAVINDHDISVAPVSTMDFLISGKRNRSGVGSVDLCAVNTAARNVDALMELRMIKAPAIGARKFEEARHRPREVSRAPDAAAVALVGRFVIREPFVDRCGRFLFRVRVFRLVRLRLVLIRVDFSNYLS